MQYTQTAGGTRTGAHFQHSGTCDICGSTACPTLYDASLRLRNRRIWAWACPECFAAGQGKLGVGLGQRYDAGDHK